jgi:inner membrane protein
LDNLTHSLFGATLARTPLSRAGRGTMAAVILASNAPDVDIVATAGGAVKYLEWHRGLTHGPLGIVGLGIVSAGVAWLGRGYYDRRWPERRGVEHDASFGMLVAVSILAVLLHVLMDLPTSYGTRLLSPFDWHWFAVDWMPIVDVYLLLALVIGLLGRPTPARRITRRWTSRRACSVRPCRRRAIRRPRPAR